MNTEKGKRIYKTIMLILVVALVTFILTSAIMYNKFTGNNSYALISENPDLNAKINSIKKVLEKDFLGDINEEKLIDGAIKGYMEGLEDEYTEYFSKEEMEDFKTETEGTYTGIGIYILQNIEDNNVIILAPIKGSPAEKAGIKSGDIIKKVDEKEYTAEDFEKISSDIKGEKGTKVKLEIQRGEEILTFDIERNKIDLYPIETKVLEKQIGYIDITSFDDGCSKEFKENYNKLKKENVKALIIDLRNNGGGIVDEALEILDYILEKDSTMMITVDKKNNEVIEKAKTKPIINMPIVVLVNENTASASEIFASALKENNKATIVGTKTYGKGVIQELLTLSDGSGVKITTEEYYTPNKNKINKEGIKPDVEAKLPSNIENIFALQGKDDTQLRKAVDILKEKLNNNA